MDFDFVLADVRLIGALLPVDVGVRGGGIAAIAGRLPREARVVEGGGRLLFPGFVESHIHLDKADILDRCPIVAGTLAEAVSLSRRAKAAFTEEDVYRRASGVVERAILHGTTLLRTFVEVDREAGLRSLGAIDRLRRDRAGEIEIEICAFAQDGTTDVPGALDLLAEALAGGADLVGGCPYTDVEPGRHIADIFDLAERFGVAVDFHLDFSLDPERTDLPAVVRETLRRGYAGRVSLGHVTNLSMMTPERVARVGGALAGAGIGVVALPATDLFLMGRDHERAVPRGIAPLERLAAEGVATAIASNNVLNPFTPFGNAALPRMLDLYLHAAQLRTDAEVAGAFDLIGAGAARVMGRERSLRVGDPATFVLLDAPDPVAAARTSAPAVAGWFNGRRTFERPAVIRHWRLDR